MGMTLLDLPQDGLMVLLYLLNQTHMLLQNY